MVTEKNKQRIEEREIDIIPLLKVLLSRWWLMLLIGCIFAGAAYGSTKLLVKPTYRSGFTAYVNNQRVQGDRSTIVNSDLLAAQQITKTFSYIIRSNSVLSASLESIDSDLTIDEFNKMVSTEIKDDTELISVYVVSKDPQLSYDLANAIANTAPKNMSSIVEGSSMKIVDYPVLNIHRFGPSYIKYAILGFLVGALIVAIRTIIIFFMDDKVKNEQEIEERFDIPILGVIPDISASSAGKGGYEKNYGYQQTTT